MIVLLRLSFVLFWYVVFTISLLWYLICRGQSRFLILLHHLHHCHHSVQKFITLNITVMALATICCSWILKHNIYEVNGRLRLMMVSHSRALFRLSIHTSFYATEYDLSTNIGQEKCFIAFMFVGDERTLLTQQLSQ